MVGREGGRRKGCREAGIDTGGGGPSHGTTGTTKEKDTTQGDRECGAAELLLACRGWLGAGSLSSFGSVIIDLSSVRLSIPPLSFSRRREDEL